MHRDLKPQNILFKSSLNDTDIVIADFGLAMFTEVEPLFKRCGTPGFVAPEIL
jgi:serine/threonine protein kinase